MEQFDIDVSKVNPKYVVLWKGQPLGQYSVEKIQKSRGRTVAFTLEQIINRDGAECRRCHRTTHLTLDHIVPISLLKDMGVTEAESYCDQDNFQILCRLCNGFKSNRLDFSDLRTKQILIKYLERI